VPVPTPLPQGDNGWSNGTGPNITR